MTLPISTEEIEVPEEASDSFSLQVDLGNGDLITITVSGYEDPLDGLRALAAIAQREYLDQIGESLLTRVREKEIG